MIGLPSSVRVFLSSEPCDLRKGVDGLAAEVRRRGGDPYSGFLYVFASKGRNRIKILTWDHGGFVVWYKRLETGCFAVPRVEDGAATVVLDPRDLALLLDGVDYRRVIRPKLWEPQRAA